MIVEHCRTMQKNKKLLTVVHCHGEINAGSTDS